MFNPAGGDKKGRSTLRPYARRFRALPPDDAPLEGAPLGHLQLRKRSSSMCKSPSVVLSPT